MNIDEGLEFLLRHFKIENSFPRTIMTKKLGYQKLVFSSSDALDYFKKSNYEDCRINAFPAFVEFKGIQRCPPDFVFIDLDESNFENKLELEAALSKTTKKISDTLKGSRPTVLSTGNGYHVYQPLDSVVLEQYDIFAKFDNPSTTFLRFAKHYLSCGKADISNNPSFKSCLLRIPSSINSKIVFRNDVKDSDPHDKEQSVVKIVQSWNGFRPSIKLILRDFLHYLINQKIIEEKSKERIHRKSLIMEKRQGVVSGPRASRINWIEQLLSSPIEDYRKHCIILILSPYLINIKGISVEDAELVVMDWLEKCNHLKSLDFEPRCLLKKAVKVALNKKIPPMKFNTLKEKNFTLYAELYRSLHQSHVDLKI